MRAETINVLLVDDNKRLISAWERLISQQPDMKFVGSLASADELTSTARAAAANIVLLDLSMDGRDPLSAVAELARECPEVRTLIYSGHSRDDWYDRARDAGAIEFVDKAEDPIAILALIRRLAHSSQSTI